MDADTATEIETPKRRRVLSPREQNVAKRGRRSAWSMEFGSRGGRGREPQWERPPAKPKRDEIEARLAERPIVDTRSLTGQLLGDPLPGQSALDKQKTCSLAGTGF